MSGPDPAHHMNPIDHHTAGNMPTHPRSPLSRRHALLLGATALAVVMLATAWGASQLTEGGARALAFAVLIFTNLALIFSNRSRVGSLWASLRVPNHTLWVVVMAALGLLGLVLYVPWLARLFLFDALPLAWLAGAAGLGLASMLWFELIKAIQGKII